MLKCSTLQTWGIVLQVSLSTSARLDSSFRLLLQYLLTKNQEGKCFWLYRGSLQAEACSSSLQAWHLVIQKQKKACIINTFRYADRMQNNKQEFPADLAGWKAAVAFGQGTVCLGKSALGEGGDPQLASARRPLWGAERGGLSKRKLSVWSHSSCEQLLFCKEAI